MQHDVEIEIETTNKSGRFISALYLNKNKNAAVTLVSEGLVTVHRSQQTHFHGQSSYMIPRWVIMWVSKVNNDPYIPQDKAKKAWQNVRIYSHFCH